eukprot:SAG11_NODE_2749_length_3011_cov_1168.966003_4_plen_90_part_00
MNILDLNNDIMSKIITEVDKLKKLKEIEENQKYKHNELINHIIMASSILEDFTEIFDTEYFDEGYCDEWLLQDEYENYLESKFCEYYGL